jgi:hypothetical protein
MGTVLKEDLLDRLMKMSPEQLDAIGAALGISPGELVGGLKGSCPACPFNDAFTGPLVSGGAKTTYRPELGMPR